MNRTIVARLLRALLVAGLVTVVLAVAEAVVSPIGYGPMAVLLPFVAVGGLVVALGGVLPRIDALVERLTRHREVTPYSVLASAAARIRAGSVEQALPGLAQVLADGTGASRAVIWLAVEDRLVTAAAYPPSVDDERTPQQVPNLGVLLARADTDHVVPVLEGTVLRAALAIGKPGAAITPDDQLLIRDVAEGAALLLRGVAQNAELADRVRRADELGRELQASRHRLAKAREVERRRLVVELGHATTDRLAGLRGAVTAARADLAAPAVDREAAQAALARARVGLDEVLDRFRVIARGVYPAVLRDQGPAAALDEMATDLARPVRLTGNLAGRLDWEIESGVYFVVAAAMGVLAARSSTSALLVHLDRIDGRAVVRIDDPTPTVTAGQLRTGLAVEVERLAALGGDLELTGPVHLGGREREPIALHAWLPDRLEPVVEGTVTAELRKT
jgi:signal transduction histidine kinase